MSLKQQLSQNIELDKFGATKPVKRKESTFTVLKIDSNSEYGNIINIAVSDLKIKSPEKPDGVTSEISYLPFTEKAINASAVKLLKEKGDLPDFEDGYYSWKENFENEKAGVYTFTIAEAINLIEIVFNARKTTFLISSEMKSQWISIEFDNPNCQPLENYNEKNVELLIPKNGFVCTSSPSYYGVY